MKPLRRRKFNRHTFNRIRRNSAEYWDWMDSIAFSYQSDDELSPEDEEYESTWNHSSERLAIKLAADSLQNYIENEVTEITK